MLNSIELQDAYFVEHVKKMQKVKELHIAMIEDGFDPPVYGSHGIDAMCAVADYVDDLKTRLENK